MKGKTLFEEVLEYDGAADAYLLVAPNKNGQLALSYSGTQKELKLMFRALRDTLRDKEGIGNHPNRGDVTQKRK